MKTELSLYKQIFLKSNAQPQSFLFFFLTAGKRTFNAHLPPLNHQAVNSVIT